MHKVAIAGATGYLGRFLVDEYRSRGWHVSAIVRNAEKARQSGLHADALIEAEVTQPESLVGVFNGVELVVSSLGITRQRDGLSYRDVDYQANLNLLNEAISAGVKRFGYIHVLGADRMKDVALVSAKQSFVDALMLADIKSTVVSPSGFFSDMRDFLAMAKSGRAWLFGDGKLRLNPIHGADLAAAIADATDAGTETIEVGGPDVFTHKELAELAFSVMDKTPRITHLPDVVRVGVLKVLPYVTPKHISGPAQFFLTAFGMDMKLRILRHSPPE